MPPMPVTPQTAAPAGKPQPGQTPSPGGAAPMGQTPATQPTSNRGSEAGALQKISVAINQLQEASAMVGAASELGQKIGDALKGLLKISPAGSTSPTGEKNALQSAMLNQAQQNKAMQAMRAQAEGGGAGGQKAAA